MIKNLKVKFKRKGKNVKGNITFVEFSKKSPFPKTIGRGCSRFRVNDRFLVQSLEYPKITINGNKDDYIISLNIWGKDKSKDNIEINRDFPNEEIAKKFMKIINNYR